MPDYKEILRSKLLEKKKLFPKFNFQGMAKACGLQKAYLSRVFHDENTHLKALERIHRQSQLGDFDYSVFFTADIATAEAIRQRFVEFLSSAQTLVGSAKDEKVYQMNFDLLGWET